MLLKRYEEVFRENVVVTIEHLKQLIGRPRESILRDLKSIGYYSSYNARGKFYTLDSTPSFDENGLWKYRGAYFSSRRSILGTVEHLVNGSSNGYTHDELRSILGVGIQNSLYQLVKSDRVLRRQVGMQYVYFGKEQFGKQWEKRERLPAPTITRHRSKDPDDRGYPDMNPMHVIDILIAVIRGHEAEPSAYSYLKLAGSPVTSEQITAVFTYYDIGKKNSPNQK